jgi:uncharacterized protein (TIGR03067 family)
MRSALLSGCLFLLAGSLHAQDSTPTDLARLQGDWYLVLVASNGQTIATPPPGLRHAAGDTITVTINHQLFMTAIFRLDPATTPKSIDYDIIGGPLAGKKVRGVYKIEGNRFTVCMGAPDGSRADDLVARDGEEGSCSVWEKE